MIISKKKLSEFLPTIIKYSDKEIFSALLNIGIEVNKVILNKEIEYLKIGKIIQVKHHPHNKELCVCNVEIDYEKVITIVTTGKNAKIALNKYVIVGVKGCLLPNNFLVKSVDVDGIISDGIFCNYAQLNPLIGDESNEECNKIIILENAKIGDSNVNKYIGMDDTFFDITLPSNRSDLYGIKYIAKELCGVLKIKYEENVKINKKIKNKKFIFKNKSSFSSLKMRISTTDKVKYFGGVYLGVQNPVNIRSDWSIKGLLLNFHVMPSSFFQDVLNMIFFNTGVAINIYDADKISGNLTVKESTEDIDFYSADNNIYKIKKGDLIVKDDLKIVSIAGIRNHKDVCINNDTKNFLFEIAVYDHISVNKTIKRLQAENLSKKLEKLNLIRDVSLIQCYDAVVELLFMLEKAPLNILYRNVINPVKCHLYSKKLIKFDYEKIRNFLGFFISNSDIKNIFKSLNFIVKKSTVKVPGYRTDLMKWEDLAEEIIKIKGINNIKPIPIVGNFNFSKKIIYFKEIKKLYSMLISLQFFNVKTINLCSKEEVDKFNFFNIFEPIEVKTKYLNKKYLRKSLINELLKIISYNKRYKNYLYPVFEIQKINSSLFNDELHIGLVIPVGIFKTSWKANKGIENDIFFAKGLVQKIINLFGFTATFKNSVNEWFSEDESLSIEVYGQLIGYLGRIKKSCLIDYNLVDVEVFAIEINLEKLINSYNQDEIKFKPFDKIQESYFDITLSVKEKHDFVIIKNIFNKIKEIKSWKTISVYTEKNNENVVKNNETKNEDIVEINDIADNKVYTSYTIRYSLCSDEFSEKVIKEISEKLLNHDIIVKDK